MQVGDKVLCKREYIDYRNNLTFNLYKNYYYTIQSIQFNNSIIVVGNDGNVFDFEYFFYTKEELRKLKIDKIKESSCVL